MIISRNHSRVHGAYPIYLEGMIIGNNMNMMMDSRATHNVININVAHTIVLKEHRIDSMTLIGSG